jgi:hypothetical protein
VLAAPAQAESPWWHLTSGSRPAYLSVGAGQPGKPGTDEVQELSIVLGEYGGKPEQAWIQVAAGGVFVGEFATKEVVEIEELPSNWTLNATDLKAALEAAGEGAVQVSEESKAGVLSFRVSSDPGAKALEASSAASVGVPSVTLITPGEAGIPEVPDGELYMTAENLGDANLDGSKSPVKLTDVIPAGLHAVGVAGTEPFREGNFQEREPIPCALEEKAGVQTASCTFAKALAPYDQLEMRIAVNIAGGHTGELNAFSVSGGGAPASSVKRPITISDAPVPFGVESYEFGLEEEGGSTTTQAGAHPFQLTTTIALNQLRDINPLKAPPEFRPEVIPTALAKDLNFKLPAGLIGSATVMAQCTNTQFFETFEGKENRCPPNTAVGVATVTVHEPATVGTSTITEPIFNLEPREGEPARFGFYAVIANSPVSIDTSVRTGSDYGITVNVQNITQTAAFLSSEVTFWGTPADPRHNKQRGWGCLYEARGGVVNQPCTPSEEQHPKPFLSLPTSCDRQLSTSVEGDPWSAPGSFFQFTGAFEPSTPLSGCNRLPFAPQLKLSAESHEAAHPSAMKIDVHVPQEANENAFGASSANIRSLSITFPPGVTVNPSAADGLSACSEGQIGYLNASGSLGELLFSPTLPDPFCADSAKVGNATIKTPLLPKPLQGGLYLATPAPNAEPGKNPFDTLIGLYLMVRDPATGVLVKLPGQSTLDPSSGQITTSFKDTPDLAFEDAEVEIFGGPRAPLGTPAACGSYPITASFTPWSGGAPVSSSASFSVTQGANGGPCPSGALPFSPSLQAGTSNINAGALSPLSTTINREDGNQQLTGVQLHTPPGLSGVLTGVTLCPEAQGNAGSCPQSSLIGHSSVAVGLGSDPFTVSGGQVFLTGPYKGAPFGLSILTPAIAGPFDLGNVVVRAKIEVDPHSAALSVTTDESPPYNIPTILHGIPLQIRHVNVTVDRPGFTFNPTSCAPMSITATVKGQEGAATPVSAPFQAANCQNLKFAPKFSVQTSGRSTKANGTSLKVKLTYPSGPLGTYANLAKVKVSLPKALPSRLTTLNKACTAQVFDQNPANCPKESRVGQAKVMTPLLPVPLTGTAYFVSHAAESFPDLTMVLQGYGITIELVGNTNIKNGITTSTFKATPDVPFSTFELTLPAQPYSALTTNTDICKPKTKLTMPTEFQAQNGAEIHQNTRISVTGCASKALTRQQKLQRALKACHRKHAKAKRRSCEAQARGRYGGKGKGSGRGR